ncbi:MAG: DUF3126 family protein [Alphaproteobacteria bacterium]|jgi:hypothetical protein|nr:DUF3126 family protein [Alphaproteobacteria bacterium]MBT4911128.1 DUF3126 family protein [Alphaproteobacteria bacterium]MBT5662223.1 DUF3126 family protein [Alphaproteobacteria bacterium]|tara:strand:- start:422 stop:829 length:408 start_codon:yes stop_codon:yes gene_type:complete
MQNDEILIVQNYLRETFSNDEIQIRKSDSDTNLCNIFINNISVGNIFRDEDPDDDEISYSLNIPISLSSDNEMTHNQYLIKLFNNNNIILSGRGSIGDSQEVYLNQGDEKEYIGIIYKDDSASYTFTMSILDFDL